MAGEDNQLPNEGAPGGIPAAAPVTIALTDLTAAGIPDTYIKDGAFDAKGVAASLTELSTFKTAADERAKAVPADGKYDFGLPKDWKAPEGLTLPDGFTDSWKVSDAKVERFAAFAKAEGLSQAKVAQFVSDWATADAIEKLDSGKASAKAIEDATTAEMAKLGAGAKDILTATDNWLKANVGPDDALAITRELTTAASILAFQKIIKLASGTTLAPNAPAGGGGQNGVEFKPGMGRKLLDIANTSKN